MGILAHVSGASTEVFYPSRVPHTPITAAIALGSNLGDRRAHINFAFDALNTIPDTRLLARAPILETAPVSRPGVDPGGLYLNSAALIDTTLDPHALLAALHDIERSRGRNRDNQPAWSARTLDLDILLYADRIITTPSLTIPHPRLHERRFVLEPLAAIAPDMIVPGLNQTIAQLLPALPPAQSV